MTPGIRRGIAVAALAGLGVALLVACLGLPVFGHPRGPYATEVIPLALHERHVTSVVGAITFDIRGIDTLGEELILFAAALGAAMLLRSQRSRDRAEQEARESAEGRRRLPVSLRALGAALVGPVLVLGVYIVTHGQLTPGGGFQGGVILAGALLLVYTAGQALALERVRPGGLVELADAAGAAAYALVAIGGLVFGVAVMANFLPLGTQGSLLSGGIIPVLNVAVGIEVAGGITLILTEFLDYALLRPKVTE
jgi:multicomponent Na+:H+ antiporter subunit B